MRFALIFILLVTFNHWISMEKKLGLSALTALVLAQCWARVFSVCRKIWRQLPAGSTAHRLGYYWRWHFIAGLAMLILTRIRPELDGGIFTYAAKGLAS